MNHSIKIQYKSPKLLSQRIRKRYFCDAYFKYQPSKLIVLSLKSVHLFSWILDYTIHQFRLLKTLIQKWQTSVHVGTVPFAASFTNCRPVLRHFLYKSFNSDQTETLNKKYMYWTECLFPKPFPYFTNFQLEKLRFLPSVYILQASFLKIVSLYKLVFCSFFTVLFQREGTMGCLLHWFSKFHNNVFLFIGFIT